MNDMPRFKTLATVIPYTQGEYRKIPDRILHFSGKKIKVSSDEVMCFCLDGETYYEKSIVFEVAHHAVDLVCPDEIDLRKLPRIFNHPEEGTVGD